MKPANTTSNLRYVHPDSRAVPEARRNQGSRRQAIQLLAVCAGGLTMLRAWTSQAGPHTLAQGESDGDHDSRHGRGRGRERGGRNGDNEDRAPDGQADPGNPAFQAEGVPEGSVAVRIVSDDAGGFVPAELTVDQGQSVTFVNEHDDEHTATGSGFDTGIIASGAAATIVLDTPAVFAYACQIHPEMTGTISVRGADGIVPARTRATPLASGHAVSVANLAFDPVSLSIQVGETVVWTNDDSVPHTVSARDGLFDSGIFDPESQFLWAFEQPGSFSYQCQLHPTMQGTIVVEGEPAAGTPVSPSATAAASPPTAAIWLVSLMPHDSTTMSGLRALLGFRSDGSIDAAFASEPGPTGSLGVVTKGMGQWVTLEGGMSFAIAALTTDATGHFSGFLTMEGAMRPDATNQQAHGTFTLELKGSGVDESAALSGTLVAERISRQP